MISPPHFHLFLSLCLPLLLLANRVLARDPPSRSLCNANRKVGRRGLGARLVRSPCLPRNWGKMKLTEQSPPCLAVRQVEPRWTPRLVWPIAVGSVQRTSTGSPHLPTAPKGRLSHPSLAIRRRLNLPTYIHQRRSPTHADDVSSAEPLARTNTRTCVTRDFVESVYTATHCDGDVCMYIRTCVRECVRSPYRPIIGWEFSSAWASLRNREIVNYTLDYLLANPSRRSLFSFPLSPSHLDPSTVFGTRRKYLPS